MTAMSQQISVGWAAESECGHVNLVIFDGGLHVALLKTSRFGLFSAASNSIQFFVNISVGGQFDLLLCLQYTSV